MIQRLLALLLLLLSTSVQAQDDAKRQDVLHRLANSQHRLHFGVTAARLKTGINTDRAYLDLDTMLAREYGDMFWMTGLTGFYHSVKDILPDSLKGKIREAWKLRTPYRGDTENHFLMYYSSLFLMSEVWPNLAGSEWFTGQSSQEIHRESREYLMQWLDTVVTFGLNEFDSPRYQYYFYTPLVLLATYSQDTALRNRFELLLELMLADHAAKYTRGNFGGAHARTFEAAALRANIGEIRAYSDYFFEDSVTNLQPDLAFVAMTRYICPSIIKEIARHKQYPFELYESKRQRPAVRYQSSDAPLAKYSYFTERYSMGMIAGGIVQPIQQQSWKIAFTTDANDTLANTITGLHPYVDAKELATYFPEEPSFQAEKIELTKSGYSSEDKWVGGSPYQHVMMGQGWAWIEYDIPPSARYQHADIFLPSRVTLIDGWKDTLRAGLWTLMSFGSVPFAMNLQESDWQVLRESSGYRLRSLRPKADVFIQMGDAQDTRKPMSVDEFRKKLSNELGTVSARLATRATVKEKYDDAIANYANAFTHSSKYVVSRKGTKLFDIRFNGKRRILNFVTGQAQEK